MLVLDFKWMAEIYSKVCSVECMECLKEDTHKKNKINMMVSVHPWVGSLEPLLVPNCSTSSIVLWIQW